MKTQPTIFIKKINKINYVCAPVLLVGLFFGLFSSQANANSVLDRIKSKGYVQCGVSQGLPGFSNPDDQGNWTGIDVDICRAVAAAIFSKDTAVKYAPLSNKERFAALQSGEVDLLSRNTTWSMQRDTGLGLDFTGVNYYDGQGFMVRKELGIKSVNELSGASLCVNLGTTTELNADIVKWSLFAMVAAEELGVTSENVDQMLTSKNPDIQRLLGNDGTFGQNLGISAKWAYYIIKQVGNYGESFERNVGKSTPLGIERGLNALWTEGGLQYAPPIR